jgi:hypothetical protein
VRSWTSSLLICHHGVDRTTFPLFYCIEMSCVLRVFVMYYINKLIWIYGLLSKISDVHIGILQSSSLVCVVFISAQTGLLL